MNAYPIPTLSAEQLAELLPYLTTEYGILPWQLVETAGWQLAQMSKTWLREPVRGRRIIVLAGGGLNGAVGMAAARHLNNWGANVGVTLTTSASPLAETVDYQWEILQALGLTQADPPHLAEADLILETMCGAGLSGEPNGLMAQWIEQVNGCGRDVISLLLPCGLHPVTGQPSTACVQAQATLSLGLPLNSLLSAAARPYRGISYLADIGIPSRAYTHWHLRPPELFTTDTLIPLPMLIY